MNRRAEARETFFGNAGWAGATTELLAADASFRSYDRVRLNDRVAVLMDAPPPEEDVRPFVRIAKYLSQHGFSAPRVLAEDEKRGFLLLEDLGDDTFTRVLAAGGDERMLYESAVDTLIELHQLSSPETAPAGTPPYDMKKLMAEADILVDWFLPAVTGEEAGIVARGDYEAVWGESLAAVATRRETLVLRDFHVDNLMWLPDRNGIARCGLLDFQDAVVGPCAYDLMSLIEDARRDIADDLYAAMIERYLAAFPELSPENLSRDIAILGAGRHAKVIGIFTRLAKRDGKRQYLEHIPRVWWLLERSLAHPSLAPVRHWFDIHVPAELRRQPEITA